MNDTNKDTRPRIACFHGGGSSAAIYEIQCSFLTAPLAAEFRFEFFDGPFESGAGPGVLPAFAGFEPYRSWVEAPADDGLDRVWKMLEERAGEGEGEGEWVGVMGFSEGSRVAAGLLLDQQRREEMVQKGGSGSGSSSRSIRFRFGVMCMGGGAPMKVQIQGAETKPTDIIRIPTLHMHGLKDEFLALGRDQYKTYFEPSTAELFEVDYHHAMPWLEAESMELGERIRSLDQRTLN
ncbi:serine hydrolase FSH [Aspergillus egyptiacus]|nr:serine hydrolase FSH [Aspergillus egyptiacus]